MSENVLHIVQGPNRRQFGDGMMANAEIEVQAICHAVAKVTPLTLHPDFWALSPETMKRVDDVFELVGTCQQLDTELQYKFRGFLIWIEEVPHGVLHLTPL